jgi:serine protease Do
MKTKTWKKTLVMGIALVLAIGAAHLGLCTKVVGETSGDPMKEALAVQGAFVNVAETAAKAVVTISAKGKVPVRDPFSMYYYGAEVQGLGSGVIFDKDGFVITNDHIIEVLTQKVEIPTREGRRVAVTVGKPASDIRVTLPDGRSFEAKVQARDRLLDIAVLKMVGVDNQDLPAAVLGDSSKVRVGQLVLAIGNPYGGYLYLDSPQPTVTDGIVSALDRTFPTDDERRSYGSLIQTSAAINRGNSGGPLMNIQGEVIGINAAIFSTSQGSEGIGFAIPINRVKARLKDLIEGKEIEYGYLGIAPVEIDPRDVERRGLDIPRGVRIAWIEPEGAAEKAGLEENDIIVKLGEKGIVNSAQLIDILSNTAVGTTIEVTVVRDGKSVVKKSTIGGRVKEYVSWPWKNLD